MTPDLARFIVHSRVALAGFSYQQLYQLALSLAAELHDRGVDVEPEARALVCALLAHAEQEHRAIFSTDCSSDDDGERRPWNPPAARPWRERRPAEES